MYTFLEYIRPSFWKGDYNFLWIYLIILIIIIKLSESAYQKLKHNSTFAQKRVEKHSMSMREIWEAKQAELDKMPKTEMVKIIPQSNEKKEEEKKEEVQIEESKTNKKCDDEGEDKNKEILDEKAEREKRKREYFNNEASGGKGYKPNMQERYPGVYKRTRG